MLAAVEIQRPPKLYQYSNQQTLERSLTLGEFCLLPAVPERPPRALNASQQILPFRSSNSKHAAPQNYLTLSLADAWDEKLFAESAGVDCCLVIHDPEEFGERLHQAVRRVLPNWAGIDAAVSYGKESPLGIAFSKGRQYADQKEWLFAWRPMQSSSSMHPVMIQIGAIEGIAELRRKNS